VGGEGSAATPGDYVSVGWLAAQVGRTPANIRSLLKSGAIDGDKVPVGRRFEWRIPRVAADEYVAAVAHRQAARRSNTAHPALPSTSTSPPEADQDLRREVTRLRAEYDALAGQFSELQQQYEGLASEHAELAELYARALSRHARTHRGHLP